MKLDYLAPKLIRNRLISSETPPIRAETRSTSTQLIQIRPVSHRWNRSTFLRTGAGTGLNKSDRTGPAGLPV